MTHDNNIFKAASKKQLTYTLGDNCYNTDLLWTLPLQPNGVLDKLAAHYGKLSKPSESHSFIAPSEEANEDDVLRFQILEAVIKDKTDEAKRQSNAAEIAEKRRVAEDIKKLKEIEKLKSLSIDELNDYIKNLSNE